MTAYHKYLIQYMELKGELAGPEFFNINDRKAILKWPAEYVHHIWCELVYHIKIFNKSGISPWTCPFCIMHYFDDCERCEWGKTHKPCKYNSSDIHKIRNDRKFTNKFYRSILKKAERV